jgi:predicted phosphodiesterase
MSNRPYLRIIGDVHGHLPQYVRLAKEAEFSIQVGDVGFHYDYLLGNLDATSHRIIAGNHDNYTTSPCGCPDPDHCDRCQGGVRFSKQTEHFLADFGVIDFPLLKDVFYARGAWSIDRDWRTAGKDWWPEEEMSYDRLYQCVEAYAEVKPEVMISHTAPASVVEEIPFTRIFGDDVIKTRTDQALDQMLKIHRPKLWVFGHFHVDWDEVIEGTRFVCLRELGHLDLPAQVGDR